MSNIKCIIVDDEPIAREVMELLLNQVEGIDIIAICKNAQEATAILDSDNIDLMFLDINMPGKSGISLARTAPKSIKVIFTTAYREYAIDGFELQAVDYLLKPISLERLEKAINKYKAENINKNNTIDYLTVRSDRKAIKLNFKDIIYIESLSDYVKIHTIYKTVVTRETISNIESILPKTDFIRIHRSFIVSFAFIESYTAEFVELDSIRLTISRTYRRLFMEAIKLE